MVQNENDNEPPEIDDKSAEQPPCSERRAQMVRLQRLAENSAHPDAIVWSQVIGDI